MTQAVADHASVPVAPEPKPSIQWLPIVIAAAIFSALSVWMAFASEGFLEADGMTHYMSRRFALDQPIHLVSIWNRPFCVLLYCIPAKLGGLEGTRLMSLVLVLAMILVTLAVARRLPIKRPTLAAMLLLTQPLLFAHSFSELTEVPFALLLICMFLAYQHRLFWLLALMAAVGPLARPEGFGVLLLVGFALLMHRRWYWMPILPVGLIVWSYTGWQVFGQPTEYPWWKWLPRNWPYSADSVYGRGSILRFVSILPAVVGPIAFAFLFFGIASVAKRLLAPAAPEPVEEPADRTASRSMLRLLITDHAARCLALVVIVPLGVLVAHSLLWALGKMASNGEPRYMLIVAPFWALLATFGFEWFIDRFQVRKPLILIAAAGVIPILVNAVYPAFPLGEQDDDRIAVKITDWLDRRADVRRDYPILAGSLPHLFMRIDIDRLDKSKIVDSSQTVARTAPPGVLLVWSTDYSTFNSDQEYCVPQELLLKHGWKIVDRLSVNEGEHKREAIFFVSPTPKR